MAENKYRKTEAKINEVNRSGEKSHRDRKNPHQADLFAAQRKERNLDRPKQAWVPSSFQGTIDELDALTDEQVLAIVPAHWERPRREQGQVSRG